MAAAAALAEPLLAEQQPPERVSPTFGHQLSARSIASSPLPSIILCTLLVLLLLAASPHTYIYSPLLAIAIAAVYLARMNSIGSEPQPEVAVGAPVFTPALEANAATPPTVVGVNPAQAVSELHITVNARPYVVAQPDPSKLLSDFLRHDLLLTGTKVGCGEGGCGACTVIAVAADGVPRAINACLRLLCSCDGMSITTVEGLGSQRTNFSAVQRAIADGFGSQCGFCTPGWVVAMSAMLARSELAGEPLSETEIEQSLDGNLCRCTGYRPVLQAFKQAFGRADDAASRLEIEELGNRECHDVRSGEPCGRECERRLPSAVGSCGGEGRANAAGADALHGTAAVPTAAVEAVEEATRIASLCRRSELPTPPRREVRYEEAESRLSFRKPLELQSLRRMLGEAPNAKLVCANTGMGVAKYYTAEGPTGATAHPSQSGTTVIDVSAVQELMSPCRVDSRGVLHVGAAVAIADLIAAASSAAVGDAAAAPAASALARHLSRVASTQVRSVASWAGNLALAVSTPAFPSDVLTLLAAAGAVVTLMPQASHPEPMTHMAVRSFAQQAQRRGAQHSPRIIVSAQIPLRGATIAYADKVSIRHANSHAIVNAAFWLRVEDGVVRTCSVACGGVLRSGVFLPQTAPAGLIGKRIDSEDAMKAFVNGLQAEASSLGVSDDSYSPERRLALLSAFAYKLFLKAQTSLPPRLASAISSSLAAVADRPLSRGDQCIAVGEERLAPVSMPERKLEARLQASGEAKFASDAPTAMGELWGALVYATEADAELVSAKLEEARGVPGVVDVICAQDLPSQEANAAALGAYRHYLLPIGERAGAVGAPVALVLADTLPHAQHAAKLAELSYNAAAGTQQEEDAPVAVGDVASTSCAEVAGPSASRCHQGTEPLSIEEAARAAAELRQEVGRRGGVDTSAIDRVTAEAVAMDGIAATANCAVIVGQAPSVWRMAAAASPGDTTQLTGSWTVGGQKHFYLETNAAVAIPTEHGGINVTCSTQNPGLTQHRVAAMLALPLQKVECRVRHVGGAYGGKLAGGVPTAVLAAVAAFKHQRPVRLHAERTADMSSTGGRASMRADFSALIEPSGVVSSVDLELSFDGGVKAYQGDVAMAMQWSDNCYRHSNFACKVSSFKSARPNNAACRAPGVINSVAAHELVMELAAEAAQISPEQAREVNFYREGDVTPFGCRIGGDFNWTLPQLWDSAKSQWGIADRRDAVGAFNRENRWRKRGLSFLPIKYNMLGQDGGHYRIGSSVRVFRDGSVEIVHGGCEIGQGINTKVAQAAAYALGCPLELIAVGETSSSQCPHSTSTGGSGTSEMSVRSVLVACDRLQQALSQYNSQDGWVATVKAATSAGAELVATGWTGWSTADTDAPFVYATYGVAAVEVELDVLTGELQILRADLLMDQGTPLNPAVDLGQAEGGFVMALGLFLTEEVRWSAAGAQLTLGTWEYKIPAAHDIPLVFNVTFASNLPNPAKTAALRSKASGEPPMALGFAAFLATRNAIKSARVDAGETGPFWIDAPLTPLQIQEACLVSTDTFSLQ